jgi:hypothetical protein
MVPGQSVVQQVLPLGVALQVVEARGASVGLHRGEHGGHCGLDRDRASGDGLGIGHGTYLLGS